MQQFFYEQPNTILSTPPLDIKTNEQMVIGTVQRVYSNGVKKFLDRLMDYKYFVRYDASALNEASVSCKKIAKKGRIYFEAIEGQKKYKIAYIGWKELIPDLAITDGQFEMILHKEMDDWSTFEYKEQTVARWRATLNEEETAFCMELQIEDEAPWKNPALYITICQSVLFIGA